MDIHKPKAWHGWREFLKEYAIIVAGVLTALAGEQFVEWAHWQHRVEVADKAIRKDLALTSYFAAERVALFRCHQQRLDDLEAAIQASGEVWTNELPPSAGGLRFHSAYWVPTRFWNTEDWDTLVGDGTASHLPRERARNLALLYHTVRTMAAHNHEENLEVGGLEPLAIKGLRLTPEVKVQLIRSVGVLKHKNDLENVISRQILRRISEAGDLPSLAWTRQQLANDSTALNCRYADEALTTRVAAEWMALKN